MALSEVSILRLVSGEELICKAVKDGDKYFANNIGFLIPGNDGNINIAPFMPYADIDTLEIPSDKVLFSVKPAGELEDVYGKFATAVYGAIMTATPKIMLT